VLLCSALKECYRQQLLHGNDGEQIVYHKGSYALIWSRMFRSQFETLEQPANAFTIDIVLPVENIVREIISNLSL